MKKYRRWSNRYWYYRNNYRRFDRGMNPGAALLLLFLASLILIAEKTLIPFVLVILFLVIFILPLYGLYKLFSKVKGVVGSLDPRSEETIRYNYEKHTERKYFSCENTGEQRVANALAYHLDHTKYYILNNQTIPSEYSGSSQIDHIVVSHYGIFVIETKDYKGWIFGGSDQKEWTQSLPGGNNKFHFSNPLRQNWAHIQSLKEIFPTIPEIKFISVVVFTDSSEFKTPFPDNVVHVEDLVPYIIKYQDNVISEDEIYTVVGKLTYRSHTNNISSSEHLENLNNHHQQTQDQPIHP